MDSAREHSPFSRREFLTYAWAGSLALLLAEGVGIALWFGLPRFADRGYGKFIVLDSLNPPYRPYFSREGRFWLSYSESRLAAFYILCTHRGGVYKWVDANGRFECPVCGSKFTAAGRYIEGPTPRGLDRFALKLKTADGTLESNALGDPIPIAIGDWERIEEIWVDTSVVIRSQGR